MSGKHREPTSLYSGEWGWGARQCPHESPLNMANASLTFKLVEAVFQSNRVTSASLIYQQPGPCLELLTWQSMGASMLLCPPSQIERRYQVAGWALCTQSCQVRKGDQQRTTLCLALPLAPRAPNTQAGSGCQYPRILTEAVWPPSACSGF